MFIVNSYPLAVFLCVITMMCWGSWANTQKLASKEWGFPLFYWDYTLGIIILSLIFGLTLGSIGENGQAFIPNLLSAAPKAILFALLGGVIFNIANLLLVAAIDAALPLMTKYVIDNFIKERTLDGIGKFAIIYAVVIILQVINVFVFIYLFK